VLFFNKIYPVLNRFICRFRNFTQKIRNMQKSIKKSSMQFVKNNYVHLCFMHKIKFVFFHIIDKIA